MIEINLKVKPLSVNQAWKGRRFKTDKYKDYERLVLRELPDLEIVNFTELHLTFGMSKLSDIDNPAKLIIDLLQKKYNVNDRSLMKLVIIKDIVKKGNEYIKINVIK